MAANDLEMNRDVCSRESETSDGTKFTDLDSFKKTLVADMVRDFTPAYFVNVMATGISAAILYNFPYEAHWLQILGIIFWAAGIFFFFVGSTLMVASCVKTPANVVKFSTDVKYAPFMGCFAMGFNSLVNMLYFITKDSWIIGIYVLWWVSVFFSISSAFVVFYLTFFAKTKSRQYHDPKHIHPVILLPVVALMVTSSAGQVFAMDLPGSVMPWVVVLVSYVLWAIAVAMSFLLLAIIFQKYVVYKIPSTDLVFTTFIPIGFLGQGAFSVLKCGANLFDLTKHNNHVFHNINVGSPTVEVSKIVPECILVVCALSGLFLISFGYFNTFVAVTSVLSKICTRNPNKEHVCNHSSGWKRAFNRCLKYNKGFWAMTFPCGTMAISNAQLGEMFDIETFRAIGAIYGVFTVLATFGCTLGLLYHTIKHVRGK